MKFAHILGAAALLGAAVTGSASATTINFNSFERGTVLSNQIPGVSFSVSGGPGPDGSPVVGIAFGGEGGGAVELLNSTTEDYPTNAFLDIVFDTPADNVSFRFNNYGSPEEFCCEGRGITPLALGAGFSFWTSYDSFGDVLGSEQIGFTTPYQLIVVGSGVKRLVIGNGSVTDENDPQQTSSWLFGISQINVNGAVPEPGSWAMMILGFGAIGTAMRRRQALAAA